MACSIINLYFLYFSTRDPFKLCEEGDICIYFVNDTNGKFYN